MKFIEVTDKNFDEVVLQSSKPIAVLFKISWSAACKEMAEKLADVPNDVQQQMLFAQMDHDACAATAEKYSVRMWPTLIVFHQGKAIGRHAMRGRRELAWELAAVVRDTKDQPAPPVKGETPVQQTVTRARELHQAGNTAAAVELIRAELLALYAAPATSGEDKAAAAAPLVDALKTMQG